MENKQYMAPEVEMIEIAVEQGFNVSGENMDVEGI